jgi:glyoxylase-like metal-dependent hydrolase (beta-lactamase superfamily II)
VPLVTSRSHDVGEVRDAARRQVAESRADRGWFYVREPLPGVWMLNEPQHVCTWMVCGSERAVLLDTGLGVVPIRPVAERLADRPVDVVNTHYHFDHVGGNWEFDDIAVHSLGAPLIAQDVPDDVLRAYMEYAKRQIQALPAYEELDGEYFWLLTSESRPRPFPVSFDPQAWTIRGTQASSLLDDGDRIDLGDRTLTVVHAPGHSPDMIALLDERAGLLFAADAFNIGPIYCHFPDSDLHALATTAARLAELASDVRLIVTHHYGRVLAEPTLLAQYAHDLERIVSGDVSLSRGRDILGDRLLEARFEHYWVTVPDPSVPERSLNAST